MTLYELSNEYQNTANDLQARIRKLKEQCKGQTGQQAFHAQKRIETMYGELLDLRIIMAYLRSYYQED